MEAPGTQSQAPSEWTFVRTGLAGGRLGVTNLTCLYLALHPGTARDPGTLGNGPGLHGEAGGAGGSHELLRCPHCCDTGWPSQLLGTTGPAGSRQLWRLKTHQPSQHTHTHRSTHRHTHTGIYTDDLVHTGLQRPTEMHLLSQTCTEVCS